jgi:hypothetical protein
LRVIKMPSLCLESSNYHCIKIIQKRASYCTNSNSLKVQSLVSIRFKIC